MTDSETQQKLKELEKYNPYPKGAMTNGEATMFSNIVFSLRSDIYQFAEEFEMLGYWIDKGTLPEEAYRRLITYATALHETSNEIAKRANLAYKLLTHEEDNE